jgi:cold shock CspA family protein/ribosome-associated translation inhibitor RaiA
MQTPIEIDFKGFTASDAQKVAIARHLDEVERRFGRIISGRIHVKSPDKHHRKGAAFEISIRLKLPAGREVDVSRTPGADERYADFNFALADAFRRAERQLHDKVERIQGEVKTAVEMPIGTVTRLFEDHGFLETADGLEIYFHRNSVVNDGFGKLEPGSRVTFVEEPGEKGPQASTVKRLGKHGLR